jgi:tRNA 2-thiocytidine biosynthesis protein TtcA
VKTQTIIARLAGTAISKHEMIAEEDKILVAFSGGKDSYTLLDILLRFQKRSPVNFEVLAVLIDPGFGMDYRKAEKYLKGKVDYLIFRSRIADVVKEKMPAEKTGNHCFLCSRLRRGLLSKIAKENGCTRIALGHNLDDAIETFLLNMFYVSKKDVMLAKYTADDGNIIIRPLISVREEDIIAYAKEKRFPLVKQDCLFRKKESKRHMMKKMIRKHSKENKFFYESMANVMH